MTLQDYGMLVGGALSGFVAGLIPRKHSHTNGTSYITESWAKGIEEDLAQVKAQVGRIEGLLMQAGVRRD